MLTVLGFIACFIIGHLIGEVIKKCVPMALGAAEKRRSANAVASSMARKALEAAKEDESPVCELTSTRVLEERMVRGGIMNAWEMSTCEDGYNCKDCKVTLILIESRQREARRDEELRKRAEQLEMIAAARREAEKQEEVRREKLSPEERATEDENRLLVERLEEMRANMMSLQSKYDRSLRDLRRARRYNYY